jgi:hypothetical protein
MRLAAAGLALLLAVDAAAAPATPAAPAFRAEDRVIFTAEAARKVWAQLLRPPAGPPWTPALAHVQALEKRLPDYLRHHLPPEYLEFHWKERPLWERAPGYKRQYVGIRRNGRRAIYANFFCDNNSPNWRTIPVDVDDGGDCYFQIEYDVDKATFSDLSINGDA